MEKKWLEPAGSGFLSGYQRKKACVLVTRHASFIFTVDEISLFCCGQPRTMGLLPGNQHMVEERQSVASRLFLLESISVLPV